MNATSLQKLLTVGIIVTPLLVAGRSATAWEHFVTARRDRLFDGETEVRFISWNIPNLLTLEDSFEFLGESPWRWPNEFEIADALESVRQMGGTVVRSYVITVRREGADMGDHVHVLAPGKFNEEAFHTLDLVLKVANEKQVRVIIPLVDNWKWMGGVDQYAAFRGKQGAEFWSDPQLIDDFRQTIRFILNRRNTLTGQLYRDDPAIFAWETGNEIDATPEWTREIAAAIKQLDPNHLVVDGRSLHGIPLASLDDPNVDVVTTHHYPGPGKDMVADIAAAAKAVRGRKPYFVGEFGFISPDETERVLKAVLDNDVCGALYWSLRYHRREGGFYWHDEPAGGNLYKAFHWPGFPSGDPYQETRVLGMMRASAYAIRRLQATPPPAPQPPTLLPIANPGRITWQGSAGAAGYDLQRAEDAEGPWQTIAEDISDAAVQYRPLYADSTAHVGRDYYYRAIATNQTGRSMPSNVVGPVHVAHRMLVDEFADDRLIESLSGEVEYKSDKPRRTQEDIHRLAMGKGGSVTYHVDGPVEAVHLFVFSSVSNPSIHISVSTDGKQYIPLQTNVEANERSAGDYGYLIPVLMQATADVPDAIYVRVQIPQPPDTVEAQGGFPEQQLSRIEIDIGRSSQ